MTFKKGFIFKGMKYGWQKNELYRLPFKLKTKVNLRKTTIRQYSLKKLRKVKIGRKTGYRVLTRYMTVDQIKLINKKVFWKINFQ